MKFVTELIQVEIALLLNMENKIVTLQDIADELGTSKNTVSRALRDCSDISQKMKEKVKAKANEMGYVINFLAKSLNYKINPHVALVFPGLTNPIFSIFVQRASVELIKRGFKPFMVISTDRFLIDSTSILQNRCCAVITFIIPLNKALVQLEKYNIPIILLGKKINNVISYYFDDELGGKLAAQHFYENNIKSIYISNNEMDETSRRRQTGFENFYKKLNITPEILIDGPDTIIEKSISIIKEKNIKGVFTYSDHLGILLKKSIKNEVWAKDLEIIGFDDLSCYDETVVKLNSINYPIENVIDDAVNDLINCVINETKLNNKKYEVTLKLYEKDAI